jgi:MYXO-CTERM domain-containing protein
MQMAAPPIRTDAQTSPDAGSWTDTPKFSCGCGTSAQGGGLLILALLIATRFRGPRRRSGL